MLNKMHAVDKVQTCWYKHNLVKTKNAKFKFKRKDVRFHKKTCF